MPESNHSEAAVNPIPDSILWPMNWALLADLAIEI